MTTAVGGQIEFEHFHRYCLARDYCDGKDVLDVASGEGYGSAMLSSVARSVVGVEIDRHAVAHAERNYASDRVRFVEGDALALPLVDGSVDVVVSFETLEHLSDHARFTSEVRRVLRPGGLFIVSTPDRAVYSAPGSDPNPFHTLELTEPEFRAVLQCFAHSYILAQRPILGSVIASGEAVRWRSYDRRGPGVIEATEGLARAHYLVALASDGPTPDVPSSVYLDQRRVHDVVEHSLLLPAAEARAAALAQERDAALAELAQAIQGRDVGRNDLLAAERARAEAERARAEAERAHSQVFGALQERVYETGRELAVAEARLAEITREREFAEAEAERARAAAQERLLEAERSRQEAAIQAHTAGIQIDRLTQDRELANAEVERVRAEARSALESHKVELERYMSAAQTTLTQERVRAQSEVGRLRAEAAATVRDNQIAIDAVRKEVDQATHERERAQGEVESLRAEAATAARDNRIAIDAVRKEVDQLTHERERAQGEVESLRAEAARAARDNRLAIDAMRKQVDQVARERESLRADAASVTDALASLQREFLASEAGPGPFFSDGERREWVAKLYRIFLGREPDRAGLENSVAELKAGVPFSQVVQAIETSPESQECRQREQSARQAASSNNPEDDAGARRPEWFAVPENRRSFVSDLYRLFLSRSADEGGLAAYTGELQSGVSASWIITTFEGSDEFADLQRRQASAKRNALQRLTSDGPRIADGPARGVDLRAAFLDWHRHAPMQLPPVERPEVSVIIPAFKGLADLENCLRSLAVHRETEPSFEVILLDDCPWEPVLWAIPNSGGLIKVANQENLGFLLTCNRGAAMARGRYLCFLNSDTIVSAGWLRALVEAAEEVPAASLVGGMLLNQDGTIQQAGWRILANGWGHPIGTGQDANDGAYTYRREVDCVTGACFVISKALYNDLGGLDPLYAPAFYEEFDLAFRARARGLKVIYEPRSKVVHLGSASYGAERRDQLSGINHAKFSERFADALRKQPWGTDDEFAIRHASGEGPVLLVVDFSVPQPNRHAGDVTMSGYLSMLATAGWRVVFGATVGGADGPGAEALERQGIELIRAPLTVSGWIEKHGRHVSQVWLARPEIALGLIGTIRDKTQARVAYYTHDLHHVRLEREADLTGDPKVKAEAERLRTIETAVFRAVDRVTTPSDEEADMVRRLAPETPITVIPPYFYEDGQIIAREAGHFAPLTDIVFVGGFPHLPNVDAALFIANEIMPLVWRERAEARLVLVGYAPPPEVLALAGNRVVVTGQVPQVEPYLDQARVVLATLRYGAGVKGKTVDALRLGVPVVATAVGAEGIGITPGQEAMVAETPEALARAVLDLLDDADRCAALSRAGAELIRKRYSRASARVAIGEVFQTLRCAVCGSGKVLEPSPDGYREGFVCTNCFALGRVEALGRVLLSRFGKGGASSVAEWARRKPGLRVHEFGFVGALAETLRNEPWYSMSEFFPGVPLGMPGPGGVRCEDLTQLTFADEIFDLVISMDVMEHVPDPARGFAETARVLRPGGSHLFTIPQYPDRPQSITRAKLGPDGVEYILPPEYHGDPVRSEGALVFTDYGADLGNILEGVGLQLICHTLAVLGGSPDQVLHVFEAFKPASAGVQPSPVVEPVHGVAPKAEPAVAERRTARTIDKATALKLADLQDSSGAFETLIEQCYLAELSPGATAVDGGANFGMHTGPMAERVGPEGRVHAFEPLPIAIAALQQMFGHQPQVTIHQKALAEKSGIATFNYVVSDPALSSLLDRDLSFAYPDLETEVLQVEQTTLDQFADTPVRFIKLDLEGYDFYALVGGRDLLRRQRPVIAFEFGRKDAATPAGYGADDFFGFFDEVDYTILDLFGRPFGWAEFDLPWNAREMPHYVVAVPNERVDVADRLIGKALSLLDRSNC